MLLISLHHLFPSSVRRMLNSPPRFMIEATCVLVTSSGHGPDIPGCIIVAGPRHGCQDARPQAHHQADWGWWPHLQHCPGQRCLALERDVLINAAPAFFASPSSPAQCLHLCRETMRGMLATLDQLTGRLLTGSRDCPVPDKLTHDVDRLSRLSSPRLRSTLRSSWTAPTVDPSWSPRPRAV